MTGHWEDPLWLVLMLPVVPLEQVGGKGLQPGEPLGQRVQLQLVHWDRASQAAVQEDCQGS